MRKMRLIWVLIFLAGTWACKKDQGLGEDQKSKFVKTYGTNTIGIDIKKTPDGNFILLGSTSTSQGDVIYLKKVDQFGNDIWTKIYDGGYDPKGIEVMNNGGFAIVGSSTNSQVDPNDTNNLLYYYTTYLLTTDAEGNVLSENHYGLWDNGLPDESGKAMTILASGDIWLSSSRLVEKFNKNYKTSYLRLIDGSTHEVLDTNNADLSPKAVTESGSNIEFTSITTILNGEYVVATGISDQFGVDQSTQDNIVLFTYNTIQKNPGKALCYGGPDADEGLSILANSNGRIVISGNQSFAPVVMTFSDVLEDSPEPIRYNSTANADARISRLIEISDGYILVGDAFDTESRFYIEKITSSGSLVWSRSYGYKGCNAVSAASADDNGLMIIGNSEDERGNRVMTLLKLDANGNLR